MQTIIRALTCICFSIAANAQPYFDVASVQKASAKHFQFNDNEKIPLYQDWLAFNLNYGAALNKSNLIVAMAGFEQYSFEIQGAQSTQVFNSIYLPVTLLHTWKDTTWSTSFTYIPKVNSYNPIQVNKNTMQHGGAIIFNHSINNHFKYSIGMYYNREFFGNYIMPLLGIEWKASPRLHVFGLLPNDFTVDYKLNKAFHTGFVFKGLTTSFRYQPTSANDYYRMDEGQLKLFVDLYITKSLVLNIEEGMIVNRRYIIKEKNSNPAFKYNVRESTIFKIGLYYRLWL